MSKDKDDKDGKSDKDDKSDKPKKSEKDKKYYTTRLELMKKITETEYVY